MAQTLRLVSIKRGHDPRDFTLIPFGGAGPLHGGRLAEAASIRRILIAPAPGVLSALGLLLAPIQHDAMTTFEMPAADASPQRLLAAAVPLDVDCARRMQLDSVPAGVARVEYFAEMRYISQAHELEVSLGHALDEAVLERAVAGFHRVHEQTYSHCDPVAATEFVTLRAVHTADSADTSLLRVGQRQSRPAPSPRRRRICLDAQRGFEAVDVWSRAELPVGFEFTGPAIVEQADTTTLVYPGHRATVDAIGNILIDVPLPT